MQSVVSEQTTQNVKVGSRGREPRSRKHSRAVAGTLFVLPSVIFIFLFFIIPLGLTVWMSLNNWPLLGSPHSIGLNNYQRIATDRIFLNSLVFTTKYTL